VAYAEQSWVNGAAGGTALSAPRLIHLEAGVKEASDRLDAIPSGAAAAVPSLRALGTTATTAAAGTDSRLSDARTPTPHAASHASGGPDPLTAASIGASVAGHTHTRRVLTYVTSGTAGGTAPPNTAGAWVPLPGVGELAIAAVVGDWVTVNAGFLTLGAGNTNYELAIIVGSSLAWYGSSGTASPSADGDPAFYPTEGAFSGHSVGAGLTVASGHLDAGMLRFCLAVRSVGSGKTYFSLAHPFRWSAINDGPPAT